MNHRSIFMFCIACILFFTFALHLLQVHHIHFNSGHSNHESEKNTVNMFLGEYLHLADKKLLALLFTVSILFFVYGQMRRSGWLRFLFQTALYARILQKNCIERYVIFDYLCIYFTKGILHTKSF